MNFELIDAFGGAISCTMFEQACNKFDQFMKEGMVYTFSRGCVKLANCRYTSVKNDYCIVFDLQSEIRMVEDDESIQTQCYNFKTVKELMTLTPRTIDIIGILHQIGPAKEKPLKLGGTKMIRQILLVDDTNHCVQVAIWGGNSKLFELKPGEHPIVACKRIQVCDYAGKTLNS